MKREYIRYDGRVLISSSGSTTVSFGAKDSIPSSQLPYRAPTGPSNQHILADVPEYDDNVLAGPRKKRAIPGPAGPRFTFSPPIYVTPLPNSQKYDDSVDITEFTGKGEYRLNKIGCQPPTGQSRKRREVEEDSMKDAVTDSLGAKIDRSKYTFPACLHVLYIGMYRLRILHVKQLARGSSLCACFQN